MKRRIFHSLTMLLVAAGMLMIAGCQVESKYFVNGTIGGTSYNTSGFVLAEADVGMVETVIFAADSIFNVLSVDCWVIVIPALNAGTFTDDAGAVVTYIVDFDTNAWYESVDDITVEVTTYTSDEIAGTFTGTLVDSQTADPYPVTGEFRAPF